MSDSRTDLAFSVGDFKVWRIEEWGEPFSPPEDLFVEYQSAAFQRHIASLEPEYYRDGLVVAFSQSWLVDTGEHRILIDTGAGNQKPRPNMPVFSHLNTPFLANLKQAGYSESDIDIVINTHLHIDHVGWNTVLDNHQWRPTFANASYLMPAIDRDVWNPANPNYGQLTGAAINENVFEDSVQPVIDAGRAVFVEEGYQVCEGISLHNTPGHTPGQMLVDVQNKSERALFVADVLHHPIQILETSWNSVFCENREHAVATRRRVLELAASSGARVAPAHFGGKHSVFIEQRDDGGFNWIEPS